MKRFDMQNDRVGELYSKLLSRSKDFNELWFIVKQVLIFPYGNALVVSEFSVQKSLLQESLKNERVVVQRIVFHNIQHDIGYLKVNISQDMLRYVRNSRKAYENRVRCKQAEKQKVEKKRLSTELKKLKEDNEAASTAASKSIKAFETKIFAIVEKLRKF